MALRKTIFLFGLLAMISVKPIFSQKRKKNKNATHHILSPKEKLELEGILIEGQKFLMLENSSNALEKFTAALKIDENCAVAYWRMSQIYAKKKQVNDAVLYAKKAISIDAKNFSYYSSLATIYKEANQIKDAIKIHNKAVEINPYHEETLLEIASLHQLIGDIDSMMETFDVIEERLGVKQFIVREKQRIYMKAGKVDLVIDEYRKLIRAYPNNSEFQTEFIGFLIKNKKMKEASVELSKFENNEQLSSKLLLIKSEILWNQDEKEKSIELLEMGMKKKAIPFEQKFQILNNYLVSSQTETEKQLINKIAIDLSVQYPNEFKAQAYAGDVYYQMNQKKKACEYYLKAIAIDPENVTIWQNVLNIEALFKQYDSVIVHSEQALEYFPNQAIFYYFGGVGNSAKKNYDKAISLLNIGKRYAIKNNLKELFLGFIGDVYYKKGEKKNAYQHYEKVLVSNPNNDHILNNYSFYLSLDKIQLDKAEKMSKKLVALFPNNSTYLDTHGWVLYAKKDYLNASKFLKKAHINNQTSGAIAEHYGDALFQLGRKKEALDIWKKAKQIGGTSKYIDQKISEQKLYE